MKNKSTMMKVYVLLVVIALTVSSQLKAQEEINYSGTVYSDKGETLDWVNIGIKNKNLGTNSDEVGNYQLKIPATFKNEMLIFSRVGFEEYQIAIKDLALANQKIILKTKISTLKEVLITNKKPKLKTLGTKNFTPLMWVNVGIRTGSYIEHGKLIELKSPAKLVSANVKVAGHKNSVDSISYRLNIFKVVNGLPDKRLVEKNIIKTFSASSTMLTFDLRKEDIYLAEDFVVSFEYIPKKNAKVKLMSFRANLAASRSFFKDANVGEWKPMSSGSPVIFVEVEQ